MFTSIWMCVYIGGLERAIEMHMQTGDKLTQYTTMGACIESLRHGISIWYMKLVFALQLLLTCILLFDSLHPLKGASLYF